MEHEISTNENVENTAQNSGATRSPLDEDMPMLVWIRGDEEYAEEFNLSADDAMKQIGIRRSRLTQISGKELRVGKKRIGRYIRPVFRQQDVDAYKSWTRPTASSKKSSSILEEGIEKLKNLADNMNIDKLREEVQVKTGELRDSLVNQQVSLQNQVKYSKDQHDKMEELRVSFVSGLFEFEKKIEVYENRFKRLFDQLESVVVDKEEQGKKFALEINNFNASFERMFGVLKVLAEQLQSQQRLASNLDHYHKQLQYFMSLEYSKSFPRFESVTRKKNLSKRKSH